MNSRRYPAACCDWEFHSRIYIKNKIRTKKDFFLTVGEQPEDYKFPLNDLIKLKEVRNLAIFFEVNSARDSGAVSFYKDYVSELRKRGYLVMGMGYPSESYENPDYQVIADIAHEIGCDFFKTDLITGIDRLRLNGMKLFIAGGRFLPDSEFKGFVKRVEKLKIASASFGRNIFESDNPRERIDFVLNAFGKN